MCRYELKHEPVPVKANRSLLPLCAVITITVWPIQYGSFSMNLEDCVNVSTVVPYNLNKVHIGFISHIFYLNI